MTEQQNQETQDYLARAQALCEQAQELIQQEDVDPAQVAGTLRQCLDALPMPQTEEVEGFWEIAAKQWRLMVFQVEELERAEAYLREGIGRFADYKGVDILRRMRALAQNVLAVQESISLPPGGSWPFWFEERDATIRLTNLLESLDQLPEEYTWPVLEKRALKLRSTLFEQLLPQFLNWLSEGARKQAGEQDYARARQTVVTALSFVPEAHVSDLPETVDREGMLALKEAIDTRQGAEVAMWVQLVQLTNQEISFNDALQEISLELPDHADVWVADLEDLYNDLTKAAEVEIFLDSLAASEKLFVEAATWDQFSQVKFHIQEQVPDFLVRNDPRLAAELRTRFEELLERVDQVPEEILQRLESSLEEQQTEEPVSRPSKLIHHYWQVAWCLENGILREEGHIERAQTTLARVRDSLRTLVLSATEMFEGMASQEDLLRVSEAVGRLKELNQNLARYPEDDQAGLQEGIPEGLRSYEVETGLSEGALEKWQRILLSWVEISAVEAPDQGSDSATQAVDTVPEVAEGIDQLLTDLSEFKEDIYPPLDLPPWEPGTTPATLEAEGELIDDVVATLDEVEGQIEEAPPIAAAALLSEHQQRFAFLYEPQRVWMLLPYRTALLARIELLRQQGETAVAEQISTILEDPESAPERLRSDILEKAARGEVGVLVREGILTHIAQARAEAENGYWQRTLPLWAVVRQATKPWSGGQAEGSDISPESAGVLRQLYRQAGWEYRKGWLLSKQREIGIGIGALILLIVLVFGVRAIFREPRPTQMAAVPSAVTSTVEFTPTMDELSQAGTATARAEATQAAIVAATQQAEATAEAQSEQATATALAAVCVDRGDYGYTILGEAQLTPQRSVYYVRGTTPFPVTVAWDVQNTGACSWEALTLDLLGGGLDIDYELQREGSAAPVSAQEPVHVGEVVKIVVRLNVQEAVDLRPQEWILAANGIALINAPLLSFDPQEWIVFVTPPASRP